MRPASAVVRPTTGAASSTAASLAPTSSATSRRPTAEILQHALRAIGLGETGDGDHLDAPVADGPGPTSGDGSTMPPAPGIARRAWTKRSRRSAELPASRPMAGSSRRSLPTISSRCGGRRCRCDRGRASTRRPTGCRRPQPLVRAVVAGRLDQMDVAGEAIAGEDVGVRAVADADADVVAGDAIARRGWRGRSRGRGRACCRSDLVGEISESSTD